MQNIRTNLIIFSIEKMHKFAFFLLFLLKIGILYFCEQIKNKGGSPTSKYAFCHRHRVRNNIQKNLGNPITLT